jgi:hypothetical protein
MLLDKREKLTNTLKLSGIDRDLPVLVELVKNGSSGSSSNGNRDRPDMEVILFHDASI